MNLFEKQLKIYEDLEKELEEMAEIMRSWHGYQLTAHYTAEEQRPLTLDECDALFQKELEEIEKREKI